MPKSPTSPGIGDVWYANLDSGIGREQSGFRPVVVVSNDWFNRLPNSLVFVVPLTTRNRGLVHHPEIAAGNGGIPKDCVAMCDQLRAISVERLQKHQGVIEPETLSDIHRIIGMIFINDPVVDHQE